MYLGKYKTARQVSKHGTDCLAKFLRGAERIRKKERCLIGDKRKKGKHCGAKTLGEHLGAVSVNLIDTKPFFEVIDSILFVFSYFKNRQERTRLNEEECCCKGNKL